MIVLRWLEKLRKIWWHCSQSSFGSCSCLSHTINHVGEHFRIPQLDSFITYWINYICRKCWYDKADELRLGNGIELFNFFNRGYIISGRRQWIGVSVMDSLPPRRDYSCCWNDLCSSIGCAEGSWSLGRLQDFCHLIVPNLLLIFPTRECSEINLPVHEKCVKLLPTTSRGSNFTWMSQIFVDELKEYCWLDIWHQCNLGVGLVVPALVGQNNLWCWKREYVENIRGFGGGGLLNTLSHIL